MDVQVTQIEKKTYKKHEYSGEFVETKYGNFLMVQTAPTLMRAFKFSAQEKADLLSGGCVETEGYFMKVELKTV